MTGLIFSLAGRNLLRNPRRTVLNVLAVVFAVWSALFLASFARGVSSQMRERGIQEIPGHIQISTKKYRIDPSVFSSMGELSELIRKRLAENDISEVLYRVRVPAVIKSERRSRAVFLVGSELEDEKRSTILRDAKLNIQGDATGVILGKALLDRLQTDIGKRVVIFSEGADGRAEELGVRVVGTFETGVEGTELAYAYLDRSRVQSFLGMGDRISEVSIFLRSAVDTDRVKADLQALDPALEIASWKELQPMLDSMAKVQQGFLTIFFAFVVIVIAFGLANTFFMSISERLRELALVRALGMKSRQVVRMIVVEGMILLGIGVLLGNAMLWGSIKALGGKLTLAQFARGFEMFHMNTDVWFTVRTYDLMFLNGLIFLVGVISCLWPAIRVTRKQVRRTLG